jgi:hypothetical protein
VALAAAARGEPTFATFDRFGGRHAVNAVMGGGGPMSVDTSGEMSVTVRAPAGTQVRAGGALFKRMRMHRAIQMPSSNSGPQQTDNPYE